MTRHPSRRLPSDRAPDTPPSRDGSGVKTDSLALKCRDLTPDQRADEADYVSLCIGRVKVGDDWEETFFTRQMLRSMLLGEP